MSDYDMETQESQQAARHKAAQSGLMGMKSVNSALRDQFALEAFKVMLTRTAPVLGPESIAEISYRLAEAMMAAREEKHE